MSLVKRAARLARTAAGLLLIALLLVGVAGALVTLNLPAAVLLGAVAALAIWLRKRRCREDAARIATTLPAQTRGLQAAGWTVSDPLDTPAGELSHLVATPDGRYAFAVLSIPGELAQEHLPAVAAMADWLTAGGRYRSVVAILVGGRLLDVEQLEGPVLIVSPNRLMDALETAAAAGRELDDECAAAAVS